LTIDQSQAWEEMNIKSTRKWIESFAKKGKEAVKSGMARRSKQGAALMDIHLPGNPIREQAIINGHPQMKNLSITYIPSPFSVKRSYQPSQVHIDAITNQAVIEAVGSVPTINVQQGGVFIHMTKHATLHIEVASQNTKSYKWKRMMELKIHTKYFGERDIKETTIIHFLSLVAGVQEEEDFVFLDIPGNELIQVLQSVQLADLAVIVANPHDLYNDYAFSLDDPIFDALQIT